MEKGLDYIFNQHTKLIILGTFPSEKSRNTCYYNNPQNQFWKIIANIFNNEIVINSDKTTRYNCLLNNGIGLWDVIGTCKFEQKSSLDSKIIKDSIIYNDFKLLQKMCPNLRCIVFNSKNAKKLFDRYLKQEKDEKLKEWLQNLTNNGNNVLSSTSPANARKSFEQKLKEWKEFITNMIS